MEHNVTVCQNSFEIFLKDLEEGKFAVTREALRTSSVNIMPTGLVFIRSDSAWVCLSDTDYSFVVDDRNDMPDWASKLKVCVLPAGTKIEIIVENGE